MKEVKIFKKIDRGVLFGSKQVIDTAKKTKTSIVVSDMDGNIIKLTTRQAMMNYKKAVEEHKKASEESETS